MAFFQDFVIGMYPHVFFLKKMVTTSLKGVGVRGFVFVTPRYTHTHTHTERERERQTLLEVNVIRPKKKINSPRVIIFFFRERFWMVVVVVGGGGRVVIFVCIVVWLVYETILIVVLVLVLVDYHISTQADHDQLCQQINMQIVHTHNEWPVWLVIMSST